MRLPTVGGMWPGRGTTASHEAEQPPMSEGTPSPGGLQSQEPARARSHSTSLLRGQVFNLVRRDREGSSNTPSSRARRAGNGNSDTEVESPKTPRFRLGMPVLPSTRLQLPHLTRTVTAGSGARSPTAPGEAPPSVPSARSQPLVSRAVPELPRVTVTPAAQADSRASSSSGDTLTNEPHGDRNARARGAIVGDVNETASTEEERPRRFMGCFPRIRSRKVRSQITRCLVSGLFLISLLAIYLGLSITRSLDNSEFTVLLILIILFTTIFFCHGLVRLCMAVTRPQREEEDDDRSDRVPGAMTFAGFSLPRRPIRVLLARDEEAAGVESETMKLQPPAYGVWRESVRVDPNRLYWRRNETEQGEGERSASPERQSVHRPPSYASEDGVGYVVDAVPRSTAPTTEVSLPVHPSERGRWNGQEAPW